MVKYKRVLLKLSGEALAPENRAEGILNFDFINEIATQIKECVEKGTQVAIVIGGGNIWRGAKGVQVTRSRADNMGMLATTINSLAVKTGIENAGVPCEVMSALPMDKIAEYYTSEKAIKYLDEGKVVIVSGGSGNPYFSTDTAAVLRAAELECDASLFAKNIDGIYTADPKLDANAKKLERLTYTEIIDNNLKAIDLTAAAFGRENNIPLVVFGLKEENSITRVCAGDMLGTVISN
ncbi:MAG: UMP kinase [Clostridia bacterium]|nr:UMP kinase [Clostridia bacterium]